MVSPDTFRPQRIPPGRGSARREVLVATTHDGEPLTLDHGGPARLIIPRLYASKSARWLSGLEFLSADQQGFRESNVSHRRGDPWAEERHSW